METNQSGNVASTRGSSRCAMTRIDAAVAVLVVLFLAMVGAAVASGRARWGGRCEVRLGWMGMGLSDYAQDHGDKLPWQVPANSGGSSQYASTPSSVYHHFLSASNYLDAPILLLCPQDDRQPSGSWDGMRDSNISYFASLTARMNDPRSVLSGDRYLTTNSEILSGFLNVGTNIELRWAARFHNHAGHLLLSDGSVHFTSNNLVRWLVAPSSLESRRLALPRDPA
jgi:hypothetical protein